MIGPTTQHNDCAVPDLYVTSDTDSQDDYGLLQHTEERSDIPDKNHREKLADELLANMKMDRNQPTVDISQDLNDLLNADSAGSAVDWDDYQVGDTVTIAGQKGAPGGFGDFETSYRVIRKTTRVHHSGREDIQLALASVKIGHLPVGRFLRKLRMMGRENLFITLADASIRSQDDARRYYSLQHRHPDHEHWLEVGKFPTEEVAKTTLDALVAHGHGTESSFRIVPVTRRD